MYYPPLTVVKLLDRLPLHGEAILAEVTDESLALFFCVCNMCLMCGCVYVWECG